MKDDFDFELNREGKNGAQFGGGWTAEKYDALAKWIDAHPEKLKMERREFDALLAKAKLPRPGPLTPHIGWEQLYRLRPCLPLLGASGWLIVNPSAPLYGLGYSLPRLTNVTEPMISAGADL